MARERMAYSRRDNVPRLIPLESFDIDQNTLQLNHSKRWVSIVKLNSNLVGELPPRALGLLESTDNVV